MIGLEFDDSLKTYNPGKESHRSVLWLRERPFRAASLCLGLLCVLLLTGIIILASHHYQVAVDQSINNGNMSMKLDQLKTINSNLTMERDQLKTNNNYLTQERDQLKTSLNSLTQERDQLKTEIHQLHENNQGLIDNSTGCPPNWESYGGSCYFLSREKKTWMDSRKDCQTRSADLVIINSQEEQDFINNLGCTLWIGLSDFESESVWTWVDGSPLTRPRFWAPGEPNNIGDEDCAGVPSSTEKWNDVPCTVKWHWVCEKLVV